ncbi:type II secretion system F family protein [Parasphingorhabdus sp.]|jgi:tight adherence protein C|uniref:type II secretion system F family protein n=1 Tax=Parasphingorhabdus sp. TaxID=2709688 RepID=UPI003003172D
MTTGGGPTLMGVDVLWVATLLSAVAAAAVFFAMYAAVTVRDPMAKRVKALNERREQLKAGITASTTKKRAKLVQQNDTTDRMRNFLSSMQILQDTQVKEAQQKLAQAGIRSKDLAFVIIFSRLVMPILLGGGAALAIYGFDYLADWSDIKRFAVFAGATLGGYKAADVYLNNLISKRTDLIRKGLPDAIDLLVICAEAGLTVDTAFARVSKELGSAYPELADEFSLTSIELGFLTERRQAFENLAYRVALEHVKGVVTTMIQTEKYGTPLASSLRVLSAEFRNDRMMRAEEKAARLPAIMTIPLIMFILPVLFIVILGPAACSISDTML